MESVGHSGRDGMVKRKPSSVLASPTGGGWAGGGAQVGGGKDGGINKETPHILGPRGGVNKYRNPSHLSSRGRMTRCELPVCGVNKYRNPSHLSSAGGCAVCTRLQN